MVVRASLLPKFSIQLATSNNICFYLPAWTNKNASTDFDHAIWSTSENLTFPSCQKLRYGLILFRPISFNRAYSGHILKTQNLKTKKWKWVELSNARQSVWGFTELRRYGVELPVCQRQQQQQTKAERAWLPDHGSPTTHTSHRKQTRHPGLFRLCMVDYRSPFSGETCWGYLDHIKRDMLQKNEDFSDLSESTCGRHLGKNGINARPRQQPPSHRPAPSNIFSSYMIKIAVSICNKCTQCWCFTGGETKWQMARFFVLMIMSVKIFRCNTYKCQFSIFTS
jgi:hypothetical protein